jgi:hypothetical protein
VLDQPDQLGVVEVEAEVLVELADGRQVVVERLLDVAPVVNSSRSSRPQRSSGAAAAGPLPCWTFPWWPFPCWPWVTNVPQRRQRQAVPPAVEAISRSRRSGSSGA